MGPMPGIDGFSGLAVYRLPPGRVTNDVADPYECARGNKSRESIVDVGGARICLQQQVRPPRRAVPRDEGRDKLADISPFLFGGFRKAAQPLLVTRRAE